jgi:hypothetical protein
LPGDRVADHAYLSEASRSPATSRTGWPCLNRCLCVCARAHARLRAVRGLCKKQVTYKPKSRHTHTHTNAGARTHIHRHGHTHAHTHTPGGVDETATKIHYENHTCHTRGHPPVESCSPIKCARAVIDDFISHDECKLREQSAGCRLCLHALSWLVLFRTNPGLREQGSGQGLGIGREALDLNSGMMTVASMSSACQTAKT